jgi:hypothetical protein
MPEMHRNALYSASSREIVEALTAVVPHCRAVRDGVVLPRAVTGLVIR